MSVTIRIADIEATIQNLQWTCDDEDILAMLQSFVPRHGPSGADPWPDMTVAQEAMRLMRGTLVASDPPPPPREGEVY